MRHQLGLLSFGGLATAGVANFFWGRSTKVETPSEVPPIRKPLPSVPSVPSGVQPSAFFKYGFPGPVHDMETRKEFVSVYNRQTRNPYYVVEHITPDSLRKNGDSNGDRRRSVFKEDESVPEMFRARLRDYFRSGYDRGHQAPAANAKFSQDAMDETFYLTNMCPQVGEGFNRDYWAHFEDFVRRLTGRFSSVRIVTGPLFLPRKDPVDGKFKVSYEVIGNPPTVAVPTHFFKLVVAESVNSDNIAVGAFVMPNDVISNDIKLTEFQVPVEALEQSSGLQFLQKVPPSQRLDLCKQVECKVIVREFAKAIEAPKKLSLPYK